MKAIVIGSSGGIGSALCGELQDRGAAVLPLSRRTDPPVDIADERSISAAAAELAANGPVDMILIATGLLHGAGVDPEKSWKAMSGPALERYFRVNAVGPALALRHFLPLLRRDSRAVVAALSARVGSIEDNRLGGWVGYRASKAALNQIVKTISIELGRTMPKAILVGLHPGTVDTALSAPFQRNVPADQLFTPRRSAAALLDVLDGLTPADSGACFDWRGDRIPG